jgi:hypothetical protein
MTMTTSAAITLVLKKVASFLARADILVPPFATAER